MNRNRNPVVHPAETLTRPSEDGFLLLGAIVAIALILLALSIAAPRVAHELRRERDGEAVHRGNQYVRAIQLYYRRFGHYPGSIDQLVQTNNIRFLRQRYADPITGKDDFRTIPVGQNKTTVKTFFGQPIAGIATTGPGSVSGMVSPGMGSAGPIGSANPSTPFGSSGPATPATGIGASPAAQASAGATGATGTTGATGVTGTTGTPGSNAEPSVFSGSSAQPFMGVGIGTKGDSIVQPNEQTTYETWEFLYDPRLDQLRARAAALNGGGLGSVPSNSLGQTGGGVLGAPGSTAPTGNNGAANPPTSNSTPGATSAPTPTTGTQP